MKKIHVKIEFDVIPFIKKEHYPDLINALDIRNRFRICLNNVQLRKENIIITAKETD